MSDTARTDVRYKESEHMTNSRAISYIRSFSEQLERELAEAKKDAERYRWVRLAHYEQGRSLTGTAIMMYYHAEHLDAAIDKAMEGK